MRDLLQNAAMKAVDQDRQFSMDSLERARKDMRIAGRLEFERRPGSNPAEWWYWLTWNSAPEWHNQLRQKASSASETLVSQHAEVAEHEQVSGPDSLRHR